MKLITYSKSGTITDAMQKKAEEKSRKLEKFVKAGEPLKITVEGFKNNSVKVKAQMVLKNNKHIRAEVNGSDYYDCLTEIVDNLKNQAASTKEKYSRKERTRKPVEVELPEVTQPEIKKVKHFEIDAITEGLAMLEMEKLGHETYIFKNINEDDKVCMLYKRIDGDYSMIVIEN